MDRFFIVPGTPVGKGRPKFAKRGNLVTTYTPEKTANYENLVKVEYERQCKLFRFPENAPLKMSITAYYPIPKSVSKLKRAAMLKAEIRPTKKPDVDNIVKIIADSLNEVAYKDDSQIVSVSISKYYATIPRVEVAIIDLTVEAEEFLAKTESYPAINCDYYSPSDRKCTYGDGDDYCTEGPCEVWEQQREDRHD